MGREELEPKTESMRRSLPWGRASARLALLVADSSRPAEIVPLDKPRIVLGSGAGATVRVSGRYVSRRHCEIRRVGRRLLLRDLDSSNGTELDGQRVSEAELAPGALLYLGDVSATVVEQVELPLAVDSEAHSCATASAWRFEGMIGAAPESLERFHLLNRLARATAPTLILGPSGVGKELAALALHRLSGRMRGPLQIVNGGALPAGLAESELFGARRGAFTGAQDRSGAFVRADGGTLFLDEVGELPSEVQPKLLRALEAGEVQPLGAATPIKVDVRVVAATNRSLAEATDDGSFRSDLFYRLRALSVEIPPLRERPQDVVPIAQEMLSRSDYGGRTLSVSAARWLEHQDFPGNVRELRNLLSAAMALSRAPVLERSCLAVARRMARGRECTPPLTAAMEVRDERLGPLDRAIVTALHKENGSRKRALSELNMPRSTFYARLRRLRDNGIVTGLAECNHG